VGVFELTHLAPLLGDGISRRVLGVPVLVLDGLLVGVESVRNPYFGEVLPTHLLLEQVVLEQRVVIQGLAHVFELVLAVRGRPGHLLQVLDVHVHFFPLLLVNQGQLDRVLKSHGSLSLLLPHQPLPLQLLLASWQLMLLN